MKKYCFLALLFIYSGIFAGNIFTLSQNSEHEECDEQNKKIEDQSKCEKCARSQDKNEFVNYCDTCNLKICEGCNIEISEKEKLFLDKSRDYFFIKTQCCKCKKELKLYGSTFHSEMRQWILLDRAKNGEEYTALYEV